MGTYTEGITNHRVPNFHDVADVIARLSPTVPVLMQVYEFDKSVNPGCILPRPEWTLDEYDKVDFIGPWGFILRFGTHVAQISAFTRHSEFLLMAEAQAVYLPAVRSIARSLGGTRLILKADSQDALGDSPVYLKDGNATLDDCVGLIQKAWGDPHPKTEVINEVWEAYRERRIQPWFLESLCEGI
jgi:hypothetical protein